MTLKEFTIDYGAMATILVCAVILLVAYALGAFP